MYSVLSRSQQPAASTSSPRPPRKSSFLSLRREKGKSVQANNIQPIPPPSSGTSSTHCMQPSYPDPFSRSKTNMVSRVFKGNSKHPRSLPSHNRPCKFRRLVTIQHIYSLRSSLPRTSLRLPPLYIAMCVCVQTRDLQGNRIRTIFSPLPIFRCPDHPPPNTQRRLRALPSTTWHREILLNIFLLWQHPRPEWM